MSTITYRGSLLPYLQNQTREYSPVHGWLYRADYKGLSELQMTALQNDFVAAGIQCSITVHQGGMCTLYAEDSTQQFTLDTWQILGNEEHRDGFSHPAVVSLLSDDQMAAIRTHLENNDTPAIAFAAPPTGSTAVSLASFANTIVQRIYSLNQRGSPEYRHGQYVLRHSTNVSNRWNSNISDFGIDAIYTLAQLLSEVQDGSLWINPLPGRLVYKLANIPAPLSQSNYQWGWLKGAAIETTAANNRIEITQEYILEQWSTDYYTPR